MRLDVKSTRSLDGVQSWKTADQFYSTYWGGLDARIYANSVLLDEILVLQYTVQEAVMPLFSYADYTYGAVMHGARRVQGSFTINYKRESSLFELLRTLRIDRPKRPTPGNSEAYRIALGGAATLDHFTALAAADGNVEKDESGRIKFDPVLLSQVAQDFERAIWGQPSLQPADKTSSVSRAITRQVQEENARRAPRFEVQGQFDLNIRFGSSSTQSLPRLNVIGYSQAERVDNQQVELPVETSLRILGVALTGVEKSVDDSGRPVLENYTFIAKDVL